MKSKIKVGNLLENVKSGFIAHCCNAQGVQNSGFAKSVKEKYPGAYTSYRNDYENGLLKLGYNNFYYGEPNLVIVNSIGQFYYGTDRRQVDYEAVVKCFEGINLRMKIIDSIEKELHIPFFAAGLAGGKWNIIKAIVEETIEFPITVWSLNGKYPDGSDIDLNSI